MKYIGLQFSNVADKTVEIDIEGYIGWDPWDSPEDQIHTKEKMKAELKKIAQLKADTIIVNINSYGGDGNHGISIHDLLAENPAHIITKVNGMTASAASIIAMAGDDRKMSDNALFLIHNAASSVWGDKNNAKTLAADLQKFDDLQANIFAKVTGKEKQEMLDLMNEGKGRGKWFTADEAKALGLITEIFEPRKAAAYFSNDLLEKQGLPPIPDTSSHNNEAEGIAKTIINEIKNFFQSNTKPMNKTDFQRLAKAVGVEGFVVTDNGFFLNNDQAKAVEAHLKKIEDERKAYEGLKEEETVADLHTQITNLSKGKTDAVEKISALDAEIEKLSKTPPAKPTAASASGDDDGDDLIDEEAVHFYNLSKVK